MPESKADCGETFSHDPHIFRTEKGKVKACDGDLVKRLSQPEKPYPEKKRTT